MLIIFNLIGAGILIFAFAIGAGAAFLLGAKTDAPTMVVGGLVALVLDLIYRMGVGEQSLLHPRRGGHVFFIPAWVIGLGLFMTGALGLVLPGNGRELSREYSRRIMQPEGQRQRSEPVARQQTALAQPQQSHAELKLTMISGTGQGRLATINGEPFAPGETHNVKVAQRKVSLTCVEIREQSVLARIAGESHSRELKFGEPVALDPAR